jgi:hypothetical protein
MAAFEGAIARAHRDTIERTVIDQIEARDAVKPAAIVWALIKVHGRLSTDVWRSIEDALVDGDNQLEGRIGSFVDSFIAARNFRQGADGSLAYYHGKVEAGIETALAAHPQVVRRSLRLLIDVLLARDDAFGGIWGVETAVQILVISRRISHATPELGRYSHDRIDAYVHGRLESSGRELAEALTLAASAGSRHSRLAEFARWLEHAPDADFSSGSRWEKPERDASWYAEMRADPKVRDLAQRFVRTALADHQTVFPEYFADELALMAGDVTPAFFDAAMASIGDGYLHNSYVIAAGALADPERYEAVVDAAVAVQRPTQAELDKAANDRLLVINDEVDADYADHVAHDDDGLTAYMYIGAYVEHVRSERGWPSLVEHRHAAELRSHWLWLLGRDKGPEPQAEEIEAAVQCAIGSDDERRAWIVLLKRWDRRYADRLLDRMVEGAHDVETRRAALDCVLDHLPDLMRDIVARLTMAQADNRLVQLAGDLAQRAAARKDNERARRDVALALISALPDVYQAIARAELAIREGRPPVLAPDVCAFVASIDDPSEDVRSMRLRLAQYADIDAAEDAREVLAWSDDDQDALAAIRFAVRHGMRAEVEKALDHKFAYVAAAALTALADPVPAPLPRAILERGGRESKPVRKALLAQIRVKPHEAHIATLLMLTHDQWSEWAPYEKDDGDYPVAREAADVIASLDTMPDDVLGELVEHACSTDDLGLMHRMLTCVVKHGAADRRIEVVEISRHGKRMAVRRAAARVLFDQQAHLADETIAKLDEDMVLFLPAPIASFYAMIIGLRGQVDRIDSLAAGLAASDDRRIFLALLAAALRGRDPERSARIGAMLPDGHPARCWALGDEVIISPDMLIDLGDASCVNEALNWMVGTITAQD